MVLFIFNLKMSRISKSQKTVFPSSLVFKILDGDLEVVIVGITSHIANRNLDEIPSLGLLKLGLVRLSRLLWLTFRVF
jgi:hypothetical protein